MTLRCAHWATSIGAPPGIAPWTNGDICCYVEGNIRNSLRWEPMNSRTSRSSRSQSSEWCGEICGQLQSLRHSFELNSLHLLQPLPLRNELLEIPWIHLQCGIVKPFEATPGISAKPPHESVLHLLLDRFYEKCHFSQEIGWN